MLSVRQPGEPREWLVFEGGTVVSEPPDVSDRTEDPPEGEPDEEP